MVSRRFTTSTILLAAGAALWAAPSSAQITFQPSPASFTAAWGAQQQAIQEDLHKNDWAPGAARARAPLLRRPPPLRPVTDTRYRPDPAVTRQVEERYVAFIAKNSPHDAEVIRADMTRINPVEAWARYTAEDGLAAGDVADAFASYWALNWAVATGGDTNRAGMAGLREQARRTLSASPSFARLSNAQRQEMAEVLMINFIYQRDGYLALSKRGDQALLQQARNAARTRFQDGLGINPAELALTGRGLVRR